MRLKVFSTASPPSTYAAVTALNRTRAGICKRHTWSAYAEPISMESAIFPFMAKDIAFYKYISCADGQGSGRLTRNSVVLGTSAKSVMPRNFSSTANPCNTTSTVSTSISAIRAYNIVALINMTELFVLLQLGASWAPVTATSTAATSTSTAGRGNGL